MNNDIKRLLLWLVVALVVIGSILLIIFSAGQSTPDSNNNNKPPQKLTKEVTADDWTRGNKDAKVTLVEYSDFQCPACGFWEPEVKKLLIEYGKDINLVYRHFPLKNLHKNSQAAAQASEAAGLQNKFWEMHDLLFTKQGSWSNLNAEDLLKAFTGYAVEIGIDSKKFQENFTSEKVIELVSEDEAGGNEAGIDSTPSFFLKGVKIKVESYDQLSTAVRQALAATP